MSLLPDAPRCLQSCLPWTSVERVNEPVHAWCELIPPLPLPTEHKFLIVEAFRQRGFAVGMTGDGVNDAPSIKRADVGIAVSGATDAARAAADLVLTAPGLSTIVEAIVIARCIFVRMKTFIK